MILKICVNLRNLRLNWFLAAAEGRTATAGQAIPRCPAIK
jgi:hypothetical protein